MPYLRYFFSFLTLILITTNGISQADISTDSIAIRQVLVAMFDGMREGDSAKVGSVFKKDVRMFSAYRNSSGNSVLKEEQLSDFLKAVGTPHEEIWNEKIYNTSIQIDRDIAQVWTEYTFYINKTFSHCGIDAFQLVREENIWRIISLMDTRRKEGCIKY